MAGAARSSDARSSSAAGSHRGECSTTVAGGCVNPIRLRGYYQRTAADTGELLALLGSADGTGVVVVSCKDRRACCCPSCARLYEKDAYQLLAAGLRGGKCVPASVGTHPALMLTLTAPSFGAVHGNRDQERPCRCGRAHDPEDPLVGTAIDPGSYRYAEQVIWNHYAPELWKRTVQAIRRGLAQALGVPRSKLSQTARVRFAKVAEFQRRGVVHYHAIIRVDGPDGAADQAPSECTTELLEQVAQAAATAASFALPKAVLRELATGSPATLQWGAQCEVATLDSHCCTRAAGYIAKYSTKATETATGGTLIKPIRSADSLAHLPLAKHPRVLIWAAWSIGERTGDKGFKRWAHQFGYGGHTLTKSRHYSVTFGALRAARVNWHRDPNDNGDVIVRTQLTYAGRGHPQPKGTRRPPQPAT
jgi:hypothetical protein